MKNLYLLQTDKPSRLRYFDSKLEIMSLIPKKSDIVFQNIYITNSEEIKEGDWFYNTISLKPEAFKACENGDGYVNCSKYSHYRIDCKKIILTTDDQLIADGVQAIDDEFLEWFIKNPSCEFAEIIYTNCVNCINLQGQELSPDCCHNHQYKIIIPKEEPKQETLEEFIKEILQDEFFTNIAEYKKAERLIEIGAKWQQERMYSEEEMDEFAEFSIRCSETYEKFIELGSEYQAERMYSEEEVYDILIKHTEDLLAGKRILLNEWFKQFKKK